MRNLDFSRRLALVSEICLGFVGRGVIYKLREMDLRERIFVIKNLIVPTLLPPLELPVESVVKNGFIKL